MSNRPRLQDPTKLHTRLRVSESAAVVDRVAIAETTRGVMREAPTPTGAVMDIQIIEAGWNSSQTRYYGAKMLARYIPKVFPKGTQMMVDHATAQEDAERPVGTLTKLAAVFDEDPYTLDGGKTMRVKARVYSHYRQFLAEAHEDIGVSIRCDGFGEYGEAEGIQGLIVSELNSGRSVDFVTRPGAGGRIIALLESAQRLDVREARNVGAFLESRLHLGLTQIADDMYGQGYLSRDERIVLSNAIGDGLAAWTSVVQANAPQLFTRDLYDGPDEPVPADVSEARIREATSSDIQRVLSDLVVDAYGGTDVYTWIRDYDADRNLVWFDVSTNSDCTTYQQSYTTADDGVMSLSGERVEVVARTVYSPIQAPTGADVAESAPPTPAPPATSTDGIPPAVTNPKEVAIVATESSGTVPGTAGQADGGAQATHVTEAALADATARAELAESQRNDAVARAAALAESAQAQARILAERDSAIAESRQLRANEAARTAVASAISEAGNVPETLRPHIGPRITDRIIGRVPLNENGDVNTDALRSLISNEIDRESTYAASLLEAQGVGRVTGLGAAAQVSELSEADFEAKSAALFREFGLNESDANSAAKGR